MNVLVTFRPAPRTDASVTTPQDAAALIMEHFRDYNEEFGRLTRRAAKHFLSGDGIGPGARCRSADRTV